MTTFVIVESPTKVESLQKHFGPDYMVTASFGHVMDLPSDSLGVDLKTLEETYVQTARSKLPQLRKMISPQAQVLLATDPDREGEGIAWHLVRGLKLRNYQRLDLNEISKTGVARALDNMRPLHETRIEAFRVRRVGDRLFGYPGSTALKKDIPSAQSIGRVQGAANRLICERKQARDHFIAEDRYGVVAEFEQEGMTVTAPLMLTPYLEQFNCIDQVDETHLSEEEKDGSGDTASTKKFVMTSSPHAIMDAMGDVSHWSVVTNAREKVTVPPPAPLIATSLIRAAQKALKWSARKTMDLAQKLFENGNITYHRSDSTRVSTEHFNGAVEYLRAEYGNHLVPAQQNTFRLKASAQDGHEAIQPSDLNAPPPDALGPDFVKLYEIIKHAFLLSQAAPGIDIKHTIEIASDDGRFAFRTSARTPSFPGWRALKPAGKPTPGLPEFQMGTCRLADVMPTSWKTQMPPLFTESSLITYMENCGIGRPSTYVSIIDTLLKRNYTEQDPKTMFLTPTALGIQVDQWMKGKGEHLTSISYTTKMEEALDLVEKGKVKRTDELRGIVIDLEKALGPLDSEEINAPSAVQIDYLKRYREQGATIPEEAFTDRHKARKILNALFKGDQGSSRPDGKPTTKMVEYAKTLARDSGVTLDEEILGSFKKTSEFIESHKNSVSSGSSSAGQVRKDGPPTPAMKSFAHKLAKSLNISVPKGTLTSFSATNAFIEEAKSKMTPTAPRDGGSSDRPPTDAMVRFAKKLATSNKIKIPDGTLNSFEATSAFINKAKGGGSAVEPQSIPVYAMPADDWDTPSNSSVQVARGDAPNAFQIGMARDVERKSGVPYTEADQATKEATAAYIMRNS